MGRRRRRRKSRPAKRQATPNRPPLTGTQAAKAAVVKKRGAAQQKQQAVKQQQKTVDIQGRPAAQGTGTPPQRPARAQAKPVRGVRNGQAVAEKKLAQRKGGGAPSQVASTVARKPGGGGGAVKGGQIPTSQPRPGRGRGKGGQRPVDQGSGGREFGGGFRNRGFGMGRGERGYGMGRGRGGMAGGDMPDFMGGQKPQMFQDRIRGERATFGMGREGRGFGMGREGRGGMIGRPNPYADAGVTRMPSRWGGEGPPPPNARGGGRAEVAMLPKTPADYQREQAAGHGGVLRPGRGGGRPQAPTSGYNPATGRMEYTGGSPGNFSRRNQGRGGGFANRRARAFPRAGAMKNMAPTGVMKSDIRAKENIERIGISPSGIPIYEFNYIGDNNRYSGAMAQDLLKINPDVVSMGTDGHYMIDYNNIDVDMHLIN
tara:strand:+ start:664 stop:1950 length:1287 start_codon:yes stop_codon:yes gene_type:complete